MAKTATGLGTVMTLIFSSLLTSVEATVLLNAVDEELGQPPAYVDFQGLEICKRDLPSILLAKNFLG